MPRSRTQTLNPVCDHATLRFSPSPHANEAGYQRPSEQQRAAATTPLGVTKGPSNAAGQSKSSAVSADESPETFPAPLILPGDDLALDPHHPAQSLRAWIREKERRKVTPRKRTIYIAAPPEVEPEVEFVTRWTTPKLPGSGRAKYQSDAEIRAPRIADVASYVEAFYHGLPVKVMSTAELHFSSWEGNGSETSKGSKRSALPDFISLNTSTEGIRIRCRPSLDDIFPCQLNLDDLLDAAISILPEDAYALILLLNHDLFEDPEDVFVCGRAYGGSGVAVISTARYHPSLDDQQNVEEEHAWPASHCETFLKRCCQTTTMVSAPAPKSKKRRIAKQHAAVDHATDSDKTLSKGEDQKLSPIRAAVFANNSLEPLELSSSAEVLSGLWLGRVCRTASHELGHCFGIDHCVYYACAMQGSASIVEDARQPPYLCPIDLAKVLRSTGADQGERYLALLKFCDGYQNVHLFAAFAAWIRSRIGELASAI